MRKTTKQRIETLEAKLGEHTPPPPTGLSLLIGDAGLPQSAHDRIDQLKTQYDRIEQKLNALAAASGVAWTYHYASPSHWTAKLARKPAPKTPPKTAPKTPLKKKATR